MALEIKLGQRLSQSLVMTPQLQQAIKLLQLNRLELQEVITQELMENPLLEEAAETTDNPEGLEDREISASSDPTVDAPQNEPLQPEDVYQQKSNEQETLIAKKDDIDWEAYIEETNNHSSPGPSAGMNTEELPSFENILTKSVSLTEHLMWQLGMSTLTDEEKKFGEQVIGNINEDGYLISTVEDMAKETGIEAEDAEEVLKIMQRFDPLGVCARNLQECLRVQAEILRPKDELLHKAIELHLHDLERKNYQAMVKGLGITMAEVGDLLHVIQELEPKPGRLFVATDNTQYITPDIYVYKVANEFVISLNEDGMPKLRISSYYKEVLQNAKRDSAVKDGTNKGGITKDYIQEKLRSAVWLIRSIHNRQKTIYKVTESIVRRQRDFFDKGVSALKPMILKDVAEDIGMHESTVSRVTTNKFVHTPVGTYELKFFFNSGISATDGSSDVASESVKEKIKHLVTKEDHKKPLSDQKIVELLKKENIDIARRTVAKYRELLGILPSSRRKKTFN